MPFDYKASLLQPRKENESHSPPGSSVLDQLGVSQMFGAEIDIEEPGLRINVTKLISISLDVGESLALQAVAAQSVGDVSEELTSVFLFSAQNGEPPQMAGYATFALDRAAGRATIDVNRIKTNKYKSGIARLPGYLQTAVDQSDLFEAIELTNDKLRAAGGVGKALWLLSAAILELQGIDQILIEGDITIGQKDPTGSYYAKMGAVPNGEGGEVYDISANLPKDKPFISKVFGK